MKTWSREQNTSCGSLMVSISNGTSVISCFDIKIDSKHWASGAANIVHSSL
ncbi:hypothetical protein [Nostoc sp. UHCC 0252]|uniref:hypothetical protein n=1 Tax=Nostoc sp. UHCC 0252 TaxID=3110241 RepID=UPI002B2210F0|nr:hypothetical protein [Nostoc sp. UHCC 0252]MEA5605428.1 hypothetical protein [Nostoc sp. UHCC 0252]